MLKKDWREFSGGESFERIQCVLRKIRLDIQHEGLSLLLCSVGAAKKMERRNRSCYP